MNVKHIGRDAIIITTIVIALFLGFEIVLRLTGYSGNHFRLILFGNDPNSVQLFENSAELWWRLRRNVTVKFLDTQVTTDSLGSRVGSQTADKSLSIGHPRILCLGDSSTFGWRTSLPETYPHILETLLRKSYQGARVYNLGVPGYTSFQAKQYLNALIHRINPDSAIVYLSNNECSFTPVADRDRRTHEKWSLPLKKMGERFLVYQLAGDYAWKLSKPFFHIESNQLSWILKMKPRVSSDAFKQNLEQIIATLQKHQVPVVFTTVPYDIRADFELNLPSGSPEANRYLLAAEAAIESGVVEEALKQLAAARKLIPEHYRINYLEGVVLAKKGIHQLEPFEAAIERHPFPARLKPSYNQIIRNVARAHSVPLIDLYRTFYDFQQENRKELFIDTVHPSAAGYRIIAHRILPAVLDIIAAPQPRPRSKS